MLMTGVNRSETSSLFAHELEDLIQQRMGEGACPLTAARRCRGYSVEQLAAQSGVPTARISAIESGLASMGPYIQALSQALNVPPHMIRMA
jgi:hypothetical protein